MRTVSVDYNDVGEDGRWVASTRHVSGEVRVGERVLTTDEEEHTCEGVVEALVPSRYAEATLIYIRPDWTTWQ